MARLTRPLAPLLWLPDEDCGGSLRFFAFEVSAERSALFLGGILGDHGIPKFPIVELCRKGNFEKFCGPSYDKRLISLSIDLLLLSALIFPFLFHFKIIDMFVVIISYAFTQRAVSVSNSIDAGSLLWAWTVQ